MEILKANLALRRQRAEQSRQRLQDSGLARSVRTKDVRQIIEVDRLWAWTEGLEVAQPQSRDSHWCALLSVGHRCAVVHRRWSGRVSSNVIGAWWAGPTRGAL